MAIDPSGVTPPVACVMCVLGPDAQQMAIPLAQATIIAAPIFLHDRLRRAWRVVRARPLDLDLDAEAGDEHELGNDPGSAPAGPEAGAG